jgi:hypothetical protein
MKAKDLDVLKRLGYIGWKEDDMIRFTGSETIPGSKDDEVVLLGASSRQGFISQCTR